MVQNQSKGSEWEWVRVRVVLVMQECSGYYDQIVRYQDVLAGGG